MKIRKLSALMKVGLTDEQFEIVDSYINEVLREKDIIAEAHLKQMLGVNGKICRTQEELLEELSKNKSETDKVFTFDESDVMSFGGHTREGKSSLALRIMEDHKCRHYSLNKNKNIEKFHPRLILKKGDKIKVLDYNKFIEMNEDAQAVKNFKGFVKKRI